MLRRWKHGLIVLALFVVLAACSSDSSESETQVISDAEPAAPAMEDALVEGGDAAPVPETTSQLPQGERVILRDAQFTIEVEDVEMAYNTITGIPGALGGWIVSSSLTREENSEDEIILRGMVSFRIPAANLDSVVEQIRGLATDVKTEEITGRDVTREYVDLSSRVENLEVAERRYQELVDSANTIQDVLTVYDELERVQGEIEETEGRLRFYDQSSAYSLVTVQILQPEREEEEEEAEPTEEDNSALLIVLGILLLGGGVALGYGLTLFLRRGKPQAESPATPPAP